MPLKDAAPIAAKWLEVTKRLQELKSARADVRAKEAVLTAKIDAAQAEQDQLQAQYEAIK